MSRKLDDNQMEEACVLREQGKTLRQISDHFAEAGIKVSPNALSWMLLREGADLPPGRRGLSPKFAKIEAKRGNHTVRRFTREEDERLLCLEAQGLSLAEIGRRLNRRHNSVMGRLMTLARKEARAEEAHRD